MSSGYITSYIGNHYFVAAETTKSSAIISVGVDLDLIFKKRLDTTTYIVPPTNYTVNGVDISTRYEPLQPYIADKNFPFLTSPSTGYYLSYGGY